MSREHLVSDGEINVMGLPWCKDAAKKVRIETLTDNILCRHHNTALSEVDAAAKHTLDTIREAVDLYESRKKILARSWTIKRFETDMLLLERWCLKTLMNIRMNSQPNYQIVGDWDELVRVAFGLERFKLHLGLYMMAVKGHTMNLAGGHINITTQSMTANPAMRNVQIVDLLLLLNLAYQQTVVLNHRRGTDEGEITADAIHYTLSAMDEWNRCQVKASLNRLTKAGIIIADGPAFTHQYPFTWKLTTLGMRLLTRVLAWRVSSTLLEPQTTNE